MRDFSPTRTNAPDSSEIGHSYRISVPGAGSPPPVGSVSDAGSGSDEGWNGGGPPSPEVDANGVDASALSPPMRAAGQFKSWFPLAAIHTHSKPNARAPARSEPRSPRSNADRRGVAWTRAALRTTGIRPWHCETHYEPNRWRNNTDQRTPLLLLLPADLLKPGFSLLPQLSIVRFVRHRLQRRSDLVGLARPRQFLGHGQGGHGGFATHGPVFEK